MKVKTKIGMSIVAVLLAIVLGFVSVSFGTNSQLTTETTASTRTIELSKTEVDSQSILDEFDEATLTTEGSLTIFKGSKPLELSALSEVDYISEVNFEELNNAVVRYKFSYDNISQVVTLEACADLADGTIAIETLYGVAFVNTDGDIDAEFEVDGDIMLLSEMQDVDLIENCGWFSSLFKKIVVATVAVVAVAAVAAIIVSTAGLGMGACIAAGAIAGGITGGIAGGLISISEYDKLDWRWVVGGTVIGAALGAATGWGVGTLTHATETAQLRALMKSAKNGSLNYSQTIINKGYIDPNSSAYRAYVDNYSLISQEIMSAKDPVIESGTGYLKWTVEGAINGTKGYWELVIDPVKQIIVHFMFGS